MERVCKDIAKAFSKGIYGRKTAEKQCGWPSRLPGRSEKGACPIHMRTKLKTSFDPLPKKFHMKMLYISYKSILLYGFKVICSSLAAHSNVIMKY